MTKRLPDLPLDDMSPAQRAVHDKIVSGPRGGIRGPFMAWLQSPELADRAQSLGELVRFGTSVPTRLKELGILMTARHWTAQFEWYAHEKLAREAGLEDPIIDAVRVGAVPATASVSASSDGVASNASARDGAGVSARASLQDSLFSPKVST